MVNFIEQMPINAITQSRINPRVIDPESSSVLQESVSRFGVVKPLIISRYGNVILAGHQRYKAAVSLGLEHLPCVVIDSRSAQDSLMFNMAHNSVETAGAVVRAGICKIGKYCYCPADKIRIDRESTNALACNNIAKLLSRFGEYGAVITDNTGQVIANSDYAYCARKLGYGLLTYAVSAFDAPELSAYLNRAYGSYDYSSFGVKTCTQFMAQPRRLGSDGRQANKSALYEKHLLPRLNSADSVIDIGAGRMAYVKLLRSKGYNIFGYEPSLVVAGANRLDIKGVVNSILTIERQVSGQGLFDWCVLEAVLNSVVSDEFEHAVLVTCNAVLKPTGTLIVCTRNLAGVTEAWGKTGLNCSAGHHLYCLDDRHYSLSLNNGVPFLQKFHGKDEFTALLRRYFDDVTVTSCTKKYIYCDCKRPKRLADTTYAKCLNQEFNIEYPGGFKHNRQRGLVTSLLQRIGERSG